MKKYLLGLIALLAMAPVAMAEEVAEAATTGTNWTPFALAILMGVAVGAGTTAQSRAIVASVESMGRNPAVAGKVQLAMILGLALIESLVILGFVIALRM